MSLLVKYEDFVDRVDELGFMAFSHLMPGFPSLTEETLSEAWHTGDNNTDPWCWKDRAAEEKKLAYGCILGGNKGFVSARMYPFFYAAFHPLDTMYEQWEDGVLKQTTWRLWQLFERRHSLDTGSIRYEMGVTKKKGGSLVDSSIQELQREFYITVAGNRRKIDKYGKPYGWPACVYERVLDWAPEDWMKDFSDLEPEEAQEYILDTCISIGKNLNRNELAKKLRLL